MSVTAGAFLTDTEFISNTAVTGVGGLEVGGDTIVIGGLFERNYGGGLFGWGAVISGTQFVGNIGPGAAFGNGNVTVINSNFEQNTRSGLSGSFVLTITDSTFVGNTTTSLGGGVNAGYTTTVSGGRFERNIAKYGGGLAATTLFLTGTEFVSNVSTRNGGGLYTMLEAHITNGRFESNRSALSGGGWYAAFALTVTDSVFMSNSATSGGGIYQSYDDPEIGPPNSDGRIVNSLFTHNTVSGTGAALYLDSGGKTDVLFTTIADSDLNSKPAIAVFSGTVGITDTIIINHKIGISQFDGVVAQDYNLFYGNTPDLSGTVSGGTHDVFGNPNFVDPANGDYHIVPPSAAIDAGTDAGVYTDLDGNVRPSGSGFDIGAYESTIATVPISGLVAVNDSPTRLGEETLFVASVQAGDAISYRWDFGDGSALGHYPAEAHTYPSTGIYTAIVTASNSLNTVTATTTVTVYVTPVAGLTVSNTSPTVLGQPTGLTGRN